MHRILKRQLKKCFDDPDQLGEEFHDFLELINTTYENFEETNTRGARTVEISTKELSNALTELEKHKHTLEEVVDERTQQLQQTIADLEESRIQAEKANEAKSLFLANMSHEIRSPLNAINGFSELILVNNKNLYPEQLDYLSNIKLSSENLSEIINNVLDLSKIESGKMTTSYEPIDIRKLLMGLYHINKGNIQGSTKIEYTFDSEIPKIIMTDRTKLNQIVMNLLSNAIKFTTKGEIKLEATQEEDEIVVSVSDTGVGIAEEKLDSIFLSFEQADNTITRKFGGTGLGLSITKSMIELLNGTISVTSKKGVGSTFSIRIPLITSDKESIKELDVTMNTFKFDHSSIVVAAEDNELNQKVLRGIFKEIGVQLVIANNGEEAIEKTLHIKPNLILMDMHMPVMGGMDATKIIKQNKSINQIPIIALSADAFTDHKNKALSVGIDKYLTKPIKFDKLLTAMANYLPIKEQPKDQSSVALSVEEMNQIKTLLKEASTIDFMNLKNITQKVNKAQEIIGNRNHKLSTKLKRLEDYIYDMDEENFKIKVNELICLEH